MLNNVGEPKEGAYRRKEGTTPVTMGCPETASRGEALTHVELENIW